ncbi:hypothetical protein [Streptomyces kaniharaensis]|uniref:hypothetical protein n=1 Tax=Streptomyces kaniharaensis TaxID=212423 RepID=UPI001E30AD4C|nr:hypothetical protein [Streptomyces kaniharaensis]
MNGNLPADLTSFVGRRRELGEAKALALRSVELRAPFRDALGLAMAVDILGFVAAADGRAEFAARLLGSTEPIWQSVGALEFGFQDMVAYYEEAVRRSRAELGERRSPRPSTPGPGWNWRRRSGSP